MSDLFERVTKKILGSKSSVTLDYDDKLLEGILSEVKNPRIRRELLSKYGIVVKVQSDGRMITFFNKGGKVASDGTGLVDDTVKVESKSKNKIKPIHSYVPPEFKDDVIALLKSEKPNNILFYGPSGSGKTEMLNWISTSKKLVGFWKEKFEKTEKIKVHKIDGGNDIDNSCFFGANTITIDPETKQNIVTFEYGTVIKAMREGLDEDGNEVGSPAILFIDEFASCPTHITIRLNGLLGTDNPKRSIVLDNGEVITSHSGFKVVCAGNTAGRGLSEEWQTHYTAQGDALDGSTLNRFTATFKFGYDKKAEKSIIKEKVGKKDDINHLLEFKTAIRKSIREGDIKSIFSTRDVVKITDLYQLFENDLSKAVYYSIVSPLPSDEKTVYNEKYMAIVGKDLLRKFEHNRGMDYV